LTSSDGNMNRRDVLQIAAASGAASLLVSKSATAREEASQPLEIVDTNVSLFHWPFRRLPLDQTAKLVKKLRTLGVTQAWAGSFEAILHRDVAGVNGRLVQECQPYRELVPIGTINPLLPAWEHDLQQCFGKHDMPAVRVYPNYHGYTLQEPRFVQLLEKVTSAGRFLQLASMMEDTRTQHVQHQVADVDLSPLVTLLEQVKKARVQILNWRPRASELEKFTKKAGILFDTARAEGTDGVPQLVEAVGKQRVMFGSHAPFLIPEAALIRVHESSRLPESSLKPVLAANARLLVGNGA